MYWKDENKEKEAGDGPFLKKKQIAMNFHAQVEALNEFAKKIVRSAFANLLMHFSRRR